MRFGFTGDVHAAQLWQQSFPCFAGVEGPESKLGQKFGISVLHPASGHGRVDMVQWLLEQKADVDASRVEPHPQPGRNALHDAANFRCWETCALLLQHRANVNSKDCHGETALHYAMKSPLPVLGRPEFQAIVMFAKRCCREGQTLPLSPTMAQARWTSSAFFPLIQISRGRWRSC